MVYPAFLHEELLDEGPAAQTVEGLEYFQDKIQFRLRPELTGLKIWLHWRLRPQAGGAQDKFLLAPRSAA